MAPSSCTKSDSAVARGPSARTRKCMGCLGANTVASLLTRWNDMGNITHNKSTILVELINKEETVLFHTVSKVHEGRVRGQRAVRLLSSCYILPLRSAPWENKHSIEPKLPVLAQCCRSDFTLERVATSLRSLSEWRLASRIRVPAPALFVIEPVAGQAPISALWLQPSSSNLWFYCTAFPLLTGLIFFPIIAHALSEVGERWPPVEGLLQSQGAPASPCLPCHGARCSFHALPRLIHLSLKHWVKNDVKTCQFITATPVPWARRIL